jgi:oxygen-independent coproporphyrinogen-3 oxidase
LAEATAMGSEHLSSYEVIYEEDTALYAQLQAGLFEENEDLACAMYEELVYRATAAGFEHYEIANFARNLPAKQIRPGGSTREWCATELRLPSQACLHNVNYWRGGSFYGLGPSATSYVRGVRTRTWAKTQLYCEQLEHGRRAVESTEQLPPLARAGETAAFGLRMLAGWPFEQFLRITGHDLREGWKHEMAELAQKGWGALHEDRFQLTQEGLRFADAAAQEFLRP